MFWPRWTVSVSSAACDGLSQRADADDRSSAMPSSPSSVRPARRGTIARAKPSRAASRSRRARPPIGRSSPVRPISPHNTVPATIGRSRKRRCERHRQRQVDRRLLDGQAADDAGVDVVAGEVEPGATAEHGDEQVQALGVESGNRPPRRAVDLRRDERLDLDQQRPAALERGRHGDARRAERIRSR